MSSWRDSVLAAEAKKAGVANNNNNNNNNYYYYYYYSSITKAVHFASLREVANRDGASVSRAPASASESTKGQATATSQQSGLPHC